jgi:predicted peptidase
MRTLVKGRLLGFAWAWLLASLVPADASAQAARGGPPPSIEETTLALSDGSVIRYGLALPNGFEPSGDPRPLVLSLHPGERGEYYGSSFMQGIVEPGLRAWGAIIVAPDAPDRTWATPRSERAVLALVEHIMAEYAIDRARVLVTGYSMGGRGTWYMASRHAEVFTGAIVMAGSPNDDEIASIQVPLYLIHSPDDDVVPFGPAADAYTALAARGHPVEMRVLPGASHYMMPAYVPPLRLAGTWMLERWGTTARQ